tara:strand:- start:763 stop:1305 length:543 start_codon:yes stop_codon:yes gene_type:complete
MAEQVETNTTEQVPVPTTPVQVGSRTGQVKTFNPRKGFGFITVHGEQDLDVFVHQTNIHPVRSTYRTLIRGEYVSFDISDDEKRQALNVRGVGGGTLRCDAVQTRRSYNNSGSNEDDEQGEFTEVRRKGRSGRGGRRPRPQGTRRPRGPRVENADGGAPSSQSLADYIPEQTTSEQETTE